MISVRNLRYAIGSFDIDVTLDILANEYFVLLGMTGSGKTLFLENLCGLRECHSGSVLINHQETNSLEPRERKIGYVPQDGALFEHLTVRKNIAFSLSVRGASEEVQNSEVLRLASLLKISHLVDRKIRGLSGGERQRVALARALASEPRALILDEPVSALDEYTRAVVCEELKKLQRTLKLPVIHVCHSFEEAKMVADRVGIMHEGRMVQVGTPTELLETPATRTVANILRVENIFEGFVTATGASAGQVMVNGQKLCSANQEGFCQLVIRANQIVLGSDDSGEMIAHWVENTIVDISEYGVALRVKTEGVLPLVFFVSHREYSRSSFKMGERIRLGFPNHAIHFLR